MPVPGPIDVGALLGSGASGGVSPVSPESLDVPSLLAGGCGALQLRSPWGTCCDRNFPDQAFVESFIGSAETRWQEFRKDDYRLGPFSPGTTRSWSGELTSREATKVEAAFRILNSAPSTELLDVLQPFLEGTPFLVDALERVRKSLADLNGPIIGKNEKTNPLYKLLYGNPSGFQAKELVLGGVSASDNFVFPLNWHEAMEIDTGTTTVTVALPPDLAASLRTAAEDISELELDSLPTYAEFGQWFDTTFSGFTIFLAWVAIPTYGLLVANQAILNMAIDENDTLLETLGHYLRTAADTPQLNDSVGTLIDGVMYGLDQVSATVSSVWIPWADFLYAWNIFPKVAENIYATNDFLTDGASQLIFGLTKAEVDMVRASLLRSYQSESDTSLDTGVSQPVIQLGDAAFEFFYDGYSHSYDPDDDNVWERDYTFWYGERYRNTWLYYANPTLQFSHELNLAAEIFAQMMNSENVLFAVSGLADTEGAVGTALRQVLKQYGFECVSEVLGGVSLSRLLAFLYRQAMADAFLGKWETEVNGGTRAPDCVLETFCWMKTEELRDLTDEVLGPRAPGETQRNLLGGLLFDLLVAGSGLCSKWKELPCTTREKIQDFVSSQECISTMFDDAEETRAEEDEEESGGRLPVEPLVTAEDWIGWVDGTMFPPDWRPYHIPDLWVDPTIWYATDRFGPIIWSDYVKDWVRTVNTVTVFQPDMMRVNYRQVRVYGFH